MKQTDVTQKKANTGNADTRAVRVFTVHFMDLVPATFDGTALAVAVTGAGLIATHTSGANAGVVSSSFKGSGKYYFEITIGQHSASSLDAAGMLLSSGLVTDPLAGNNCVTVTLASGFIWSNSATSKNLGGAVVTGNIIGAAIDLDNRKVWFRKNAGNWNNAAIGSENPATGVGGVTVVAGTFAPVVSFNWVANDAMTGNFGQSAFANPAPAGFGNWTA